MTFLTTPVCFLTGFMFCEGSPLAPIARDLGYPSVTAAHSTSSSAVSETHTPYPVSTVQHSCKAHGKSSHSECTEPKPATAHEVPGYVSSAPVTSVTTTVTIIRTANAPHSTRSTHLTTSHCQWVPYDQGHSNRHIPALVSQPCQAIINHNKGWSSNLILYQLRRVLAQYEHISQYGSFLRIELANLWLHSKISTPAYTITPVLLPSIHTSSSQSRTILTATTHSSSTTKFIQPSTSSTNINTHLKSTIHITSIITVAPSSTYTARTSTIRPTHPIALARAVNSSSSLKIKAKEIVRAASVVMVTALTAVFAGMI
ncbi:hypothetical protein IFR05_012270 [Cadophora sp. M221]|nr:hypothetical protein IFR05_012270 [Cadophora sp. M221]